MPPGRCYTRSAARQGLQEPERGQVQEPGQEPDCWAAVLVPDLGRAQEPEPGRDLGQVRAKAPVWVPGRCLACQTWKTW